FSAADAYYAPVVRRFLGYGVTLPPIAADYVATIDGLPAMRAWMTAALAEHDFVQMDEPDREPPGRPWGCNPGKGARMAWVKVPPENHPLFHAALPKDPRVETMKMFGGVAAKVNGHIFAGLFGRSTMLLLTEPDRAEALALQGAAPFDPMGDGRAR